jgi:hypothetical protein
MQPKYQMKSLSTNQWNDTYMASVSGATIKVKSGQTFQRFPSQQAGQVTNTYGSARL